MSSRYSTYYRKQGKRKFYGGIKKRRTPKNKGIASKNKIASAPEKKAVNIAVAGPTATIAVSSATVSNQNLSTGFIVCNLVRQGDGEAFRDGNVVTGTHLGLRFTIQSGANAETSDGEVRWLVVFDKNPNGANVTVGTILSDQDEDGTATTSFNSALNMAQPGRFMIMRQGGVTVSKISGPTPLQQVSISLPLYGLQTGFQGTADPMSISYIGANALYFIIYGRMTGAGTLPTISNFLCRYTFQEK